MAYRKRATTRFLLVALMAALLTAAWGCQSTYYAVMEKVGVPKRDILVDRVESARDSQKQAQEQFASALDRFDQVLGFEGGELEDKYNALQAELDASEAKAEAVRERVDLVEDVAEALLDEWEDELSEYTNRTLRTRSKARLAETRKRYAQLMTAMRAAEKRMDPVLATFNDQVLYLKHNLNARAVASLKGELVEVETDVRALLRAMDKSIREADVFLAAMERQEARE
ncbi:MAG: DUF2959 domain-containing protein [Desulfocurvibacter africanus]